MRLHDPEKQPMQSISTIGLDIVKPAFRVHRVDAASQVVIRRHLKRRHLESLHGSCARGGVVHFDGPRVLRLAVQTPEVFGHR